MLATIIGVFKTITGLVGIVGELIKVFHMVRRAFQKDPVEEIRKDDEKQKEAEKNAEETDNTDGIFGGETKK